MPKKSRVLVYLTPIGLLAERKGKIVESHRFGETLEESVEKYLGLERGEMDGETLKFLRSLALRNEVRATSPLLANLLKKGEIDVKLELSFRGAKKLEELLVEAGLARNEDEALNSLQRALTMAASLKVKADLEEKDKMIIHAVDAYEEYTETINTLYERLREWFGVHFPELERHVQKIGTYANLVTKLKTRDEFSRANLISLGIEGERAEKIAEASRRSMGAEVADEDLRQMREHAEYLSGLIKRRDDLERYIEDVLGEYAPNLSSLAGVKLAGKLISRSGGLRRLGMLPASTVQLLGAEKALFRALRRGTKPPKHGVIFQHPAVNQAPRWLRGKIARALSTKLSIAARIDVFGGESRVEELKRDFEDRVEEIKKRYPKPPSRVRVRRRKWR
ncbi:MAG: C/D box methylation guide ribonucleoprotein complex aNOP56 subunit [Candidatus Geothermarchaeales archaeon]